MTLVLVCLFFLTPSLFWFPNLRFWHHHPTSIQARQQGGITSPSSSGLVHLPVYAQIYFLTFLCFVFLQRLHLPGSLANQQLAGWPSGDKRTREGTSFLSLLQWLHLFRGPAPPTQSQPPDCGDTTCPFGPSSFRGSSPAPPNLRVLNCFLSVFPFF